ncbi:GAF domain-containing protein [Actinopolymorpha sp. B11F2]|uniref:GAF domain-containing sensor histidine kinase n=1 Tax=Actinopolymorpha sp. B11F2 TaxID=3160862 RepID=UPI0032E4C2C1
MVLPISYEVEDRSRNWLMAASEITRVLLRETNLRKSLRVVARRLREVSAADYVSISLADPRYPRGTAIVEAADGMGAEHLAGHILLNNKQALWTQVAQSGKGIISRDITSHPAYNPPSELAETMSAIGLAMYLPLVAGETVLGVMCAGWRCGSPYTDIAEQEVPWMEVFAGEVALALQQARAQMLVMEDRDRIARELHNVAVTRLFAIGTHLHVLTGMAGQAEVRRRLGHAINDIDETIRRIGPAVFACGEAGATDQQPVSVQLVEEVDAASSVLGFTPRLVVCGRLDDRLPAHVGSELVLAVRESLADVATHTAVSRIDVNVQVAADHLTLTVNDNGQSGERLAGGSTLGWLRDRAERLGGTVAVQAAAPPGTTLSWCVPLERQS